MLQTNFVNVNIYDYEKSDLSRSEEFPLNELPHKKMGSTGGAVDKRSPPTSVTRVRFPVLAV